MPSVVLMVFWTLLSPFIAEGAFSLSSPTANQVVTANSVALVVTEIPAATDRVEYYADGRLLEPCGVVAKQIAFGCVQTAGTWSTTYYTLAQGESPVAVYAIAKDVFGTVLTTTATNTFTTRAMGTSLWFLNDLTVPLSGTVTLQPAANHPWGDGVANRFICAVDGKINTNQAPFNGDFIQYVGHFAGPPSGQNWTLNTFRFPNGTHEIYCSNWNTEATYF